MRTWRRRTAARPAARWPRGSPQHRLPVRRGRRAGSGPRLPRGRSGSRTSAQTSIAEHAEAARGPAAALRPAGAEGGQRGCRQRPRRAAGRSAGCPWPGPARAARTSRGSAGRWPRTPSRPPLRPAPGPAQPGRPCTTRPRSARCPASPRPLASTTRSPQPVRGRAPADQGQQQPGRRARHQDAGQLQREPVMPERRDQVGEAVLERAARRHRDQPDEQDEPPPAVACPAGLAPLQTAGHRSPPHRRRSLGSLLHLTTY